VSPPDDPGSSESGEDARAGHRVEEKVICEASFVPGCRGMKPLLPIKIAADRAEKRPGPQGLLKQGNQGGSPALRWTD